jgi:XTP/dITP diphosphohydrolase
MKLVFATNNKHKLQEIRDIVGKDMEIMGLADIGCEEDIPETGDTIESNASIKSDFVYKKFGMNCFADDTGLEIASLNGRPGVYSARYAGEGCNFDDNIDKVLHELKGVSDRRAWFRTVISLILDGKEIQFEGRVDGTILTERHGSKGFGYDPVFLPDGYETTFAEMPPGLKNSISHRGRAVEKLLKYLREVKD